MHARKAWLNGLSPKENRDIPPLDYDRVYRLKARCPICRSSSMAASAALEAARQHLAHVDGVMLGRAAYQDPWRLLTVDPELFGEDAPCATMKDVFEAMMPYIERELAAGTRLHSITRHFVGAFHGVPAPAHSAAISPSAASRAMLASMCCARRSRGSKTAPRPRSPRNG